MAQHSAVILKCSTRFLKAHFAFLALFLSYQDVCEEITHDPRPALKALQVYGPAASLHQTLLPCGLPSGAETLQYLRWRYQPRPSLRPCGCGSALWEVGIFLRPLGAFIIAIKSFTVLSRIWHCSYGLSAFQLVYFFVLFQWSKSRSLHHYSEKSWLLVTVRWRYCRGKPKCVPLQFHDVQVYFLCMLFCKLRRGSGGSHIFNTFQTENL